MSIKNLAEILFLPALLAAGIAAGIGGIMPESITDSCLSTCLLGLLVFQVGLGLGSGKNFSKILHTVSPKTMLLPLFTIGGTLTATSFALFFLEGMSMKDCLAIGSGFGYYSLSSMLILQYKTPVAGIEMATLMASTALIANIIRELAALIFCTIISKTGRGTSAISLAGINSMDVCLPSILCDKSRTDLMPLAIIHGIILEISVPLLLTIFC